MIVGSTILCWIALQEVGGFGGLTKGLEAQNPVLTEFFPPDLRFGFSMWAFAFFLGGLGVAGQPQVVSRVMTLGTDSDRKQAMIWFFVWQTPFIILMLIIGLASRILFTGSDFDPELGLPMMAMETMPQIGVGMILASIFAATMSTADSQVLACTAAITDDIRPEWSQDHKTTKRVTLVVAAFATMISIGGLYVPGGDSVFKLVVLAVYGLGGIFIPLLIIRWMGYKPDATHSIVMMISAFIGVIGWSLLKFGDADGIFPSVPGMGAAFIAHFIMNQIRTPNLSSLGRFKIPNREKLGAIVTVIALGLILSEALYFISAPDSTNLSNSKGIYEVTITEDVIVLDSGSEYVYDGETLELRFSSNSIGEWPNGNNVVGIAIYLSFEEDETSSGLGCAVGGGSEVDTITGTIRHSLLEFPNWNTTESYSNHQGNNGIQIGEEFPLFLLGDDPLIIWEAATTSMALYNYSESEILDAIDLGKEGLGDYFLDITVDAEEGGSFQCQHNDEGEQVDYEVQLITWNYDITRCLDCEG
jgi:MFS family permease